MSDHIWLAGHMPADQGRFLWIETTYTGWILNDDLVAIEMNAERLFREWFRVWVFASDDEDAYQLRQAREQLLDSSPVQEAVHRNAAFIVDGRVTVKIEPSFLVFEITTGSIKKRLGSALSAILLFTGGVVADLGKDVAKDATKDVIKQEVCRMHVPIIGDAFDKFIKDLAGGCSGKKLRSPEFCSYLAALCETVSKLPENETVTLYAENERLVLTPDKAVEILKEMSEGAARYQVRTGSTGSI